MKRKTFIAFVLLFTLFCLASCRDGIDKNNNENPQMLSGQECYDTTISDNSNTEQEAVDTDKTVFSEHNNDTFKYLLYTPENATVDMPLIVYLHGVSSKGDDIALPKILISNLKALNRAKRTTISFNRSAIRRLRIMFLLNIA